MRELHLRAVFKQYVNSFCRQRAGLEVLIKMTAEPIFLLNLSLTSEPGSDIGSGPFFESSQSSCVTSTLVRMR